MPRPPELRAPSDYLSAVRDRAAGMKERYRDDPEGLAEILEVRLPPKPAQVMKELGYWDDAVDGPIDPGLRELVTEVCKGEVTDAVAVGPRGGGKSKGVSFIEFFLWMVKDFDAINMGGSEAQANNVYAYLLGYINTDEEWKTMLREDPKVSETHTTSQAWIRVLTASQKQTRSPHAGGIKKVNGVRVYRGGLLVIDEEAEADEEIVASALPTINTARPSVNVRCSTFHNMFGSFAEVVENHEEMGYKLYRWDAFDIAEKCDCTGVGRDCQHEEKCFREDHYEEYIDPTTNEVQRKLVHKAYCGGRSKYAEGWMLQSEITKMWRRWKRNHQTFEVEAMGSSPASSGHVIKSQALFKKYITDEEAASLYVGGGPITICVDWGTVAAGVTVWQEQRRDDGEELHVLLHADLIQNAGQTQIFSTIIKYWDQYQEAQEVAADIGGGGNYLNPKLREEEKIPCRDVNFNVEKETAAAAWNILNEGGHCVYPKEFDDFISQVKGWRRKNGVIVKKNDHLCDSALCYFAKFVDRLQLTRPRTVSRAFRAQAKADEPQTQTERNHRPTRRAVIVRAIGKRR